MDRQQILAAEFDSQRARLRAVAYRILGNVTDADDAVQEAWIRLSRTAGDDIDNLAGWLTTVVGRVCIDLVRARERRGETSLELAGAPVAMSDPEADVLLADGVGLALTVVLQSLGPAERLAFVMHDMFGVPFEDIAPVVGKSIAATKMSASRARRRVRGLDPQADPDRAARRDIVEAFLAASRTGDLARLAELLAPDAILHAPGVEIHGAEEIIAASRPFAARAAACDVVFIDGEPGIVVAPGGLLATVIQFTVRSGRIASIAISTDPAAVDAFELTLGIAP